MNSACSNAHPFYIRRNKKKNVVVAVPRGGSGLVGHENRILECDLLHIVPLAIRCERFLPAIGKCCIKRTERKMISELQ